MKTLTSKVLETMYPEVGLNSKNIKVMNLTKLTDYDKIGSHAFRNYWYLEKIYLSHTIKTIGKCAFLPDGLFIHINETALQDVFLPNNLKVISDSAFYRCTNLRLTHIPESVKHIDRAAFMDCINLRIRTLPEKLEFVGDTAFMNCKNIKQINFDSNLSYIGGMAFHGCSSLRSIDLTRVNRRLRISANKTFHNTSIRNTRFLEPYIYNYIDTELEVELFV